MKKLVLIGGGGHCISVIDAIELQNEYTIHGILDDNKIGENILGYPVIGNDSMIEALHNEGCFFLITVGQIKSAAARMHLANALAHAHIATIISPKAYVSKHSVIQVGTVVLSGVTVNAGAHIGKHCIINTQANIEHGVIIENFCHISTGAMVNGDCVIKQGSFIGSNATLVQGKIIEANSVISAGQFIK